MSLPPARESRHAAASDTPESNGKRELRRALIKARLDLDDAARASWDAAIGSRLLELLRERGIKSLGVFWPIRNEPDLSALYATLAADGMRLALPLVVGPDQPLAFAAWKPGDEMEKAALGILVPKDQSPIETPEALLAPCIGFNAERYRLGYGGGFFDRTLSVSPRLLAIGVAYSFQQAEFPVDTFDIPLDCIVTENGILL